MKASPIKLLILDNILGAGKTTLINNLMKRNPGWIRIDESVSLDNGLISITSTEERKYFTDYSQSKIANQYSKVFKDSGDKVVVADRIFSSPKYWRLYLEEQSSQYSELLINRIKELLKKQKVKVIWCYLFDPTPDKSILLRNIRNRGREFEQHYDSESLNKLEDVYLGCVSDLDGLDYEIKILILNNDFYRSGCQIVETMCNSF
jgi:deoxyadenosine/deoxycytidine kinase